MPATAVRSGIMMLKAPVLPLIETDNANTAKQPTPNISGSFVLSRRSNRPIRTCGAADLEDMFSRCCGSSITVSLTFSLSCFRFCPQPKISSHRQSPKTKTTHDGRDRAAGHARNETYCWPIRVPGPFLFEKRPGFVRAVERRAKEGMSAMGRQFQTGWRAGLQLVHAAGFPVFCPFEQRPGSYREEC